MEREGTAVSEVPKSVWLANHGEYEGHGPFAAFTSEALARQHSDDVSEMQVFDRPIRTERHWFRWIEVRAGIAHDHFAKRVQEEWPEWVSSFGHGISRSDSFDYAANPYNGDGAHTWVIVEGNDEAAVDAEVGRRLAEIGAQWVGKGG